MAGNPTRERILQASLRLFNEHGLAAVSTHRIAAEAGISAGNLHYHFNTKEKIVDWLLRRFEDRMNTLDASAAGIRAIDDLWLALHLRFEAIDAWRFVFRDMGHLALEYPALGRRIRELNGSSLLAAQALCESLAAQGVIEASAEQARTLALQIVFTTTCWLGFEQMVPGPSSRAQADPGLAAYYTLTLVSPYVSRESRVYLDYLRAKYRH
ncbi:MAG: TetR/AcrR family transcriptional regulator [Ottowia sp.]|uniref:TetR/AcrR family transcriptional regulator n=1 Tax=Ottowia sp. TaxID=1898956 RepID=UPI0039E22659